MQNHEETNYVLRWTPILVTHHFIYDGATFAQDVLFSKKKYTFFIQWTQKSWHVVTTYKGTSNTGSLKLLSVLVHCYS